MGGCIAKPHIVVDRCWGGREGGGGWERSGGGEELGRGEGPPDPLVGTPAHVPYGVGVEVDTITGVYTRGSGVV